MNRKSISKKLRFEIFKRDNFTCQYCGRMSPDVILQVDHINPVKNGGDNNILNLITSCVDCNLGKGARKLTDKQEVKKQQEQLKLLSEKKEQLEFLVLWRNELFNLNQEEINIAEKEIRNYDYRFVLTDKMRLKLKGYIKEFTLNNVLEAIEISYKKYYTDTSHVSWCYAFEKIGGICYNKKNGITSRR